MTSQRSRLSQAGISSFTREPQCSRCSCSHIAALQFVPIGSNTVSTARARLMTNKRRRCHPLRSKLSRNWSPAPQARCRKNSSESRSECNRMAQSKSLRETGTRPSQPRLVAPPSQRSAAWRILCLAFLLCRRRQWKLTPVPS